MKTIRTLSLTLLSLLVLTACGGGGGGGNAPATPVNSTPPETTPPVLNSTLSTVNSTQTDNHAGSTISTPSTKTETPSTVENTKPEKPVEKPKPSLDFVPDSLKDEVREAKRIELRDETGAIIRSLYVSDRPLGIVDERLESGQKFRGLNQVYSSSTAIYDNKAFYFFNETATSGGIEGLWTEPSKLPKGTVTYTGESVNVEGTGKLTLTANFDENTVEGSIKHERGSINGNITLEKTLMDKQPENKFTLFIGKATNFFNQDYYVGAFAGPNAEEVVGYVMKDKIKAEEVKFENLKFYEAFGGKKAE